MTEGEVLYGVSAIASFLGMPEGAARNRIERRQIPTFKIGGTICGRRATLTEWIQEQERKAIKAARAAALHPAEEEEGQSDG